jgi:hypothetical protein
MPRRAQSSTVDVGQRRNSATSPAVSTSAAVSRRTDGRRRLKEAEVWCRGREHALRRSTASYAPSGWTASPPDGALRLEVVWGRFKAWEASRSFALHVVVLLLISAVLVDAAAEQTVGGGWHNKTHAGKVGAVFVLPAAVIWGAFCAYFLMKHWPRRFLDEDDLREDKRTFDSQPNLPLNLFMFVGGFVFPLLGLAGLAALLSLATGLGR